METVDGNCDKFHGATLDRDHHYIYGLFVSKG